MKKLFTLTITAICTVLMANAQTNGEYRSAKSGNWGSLDTWEVYSSGSWISASSLTSTRNYTVRSGHTVTVAASTSCNVLTVENGAVVKAINNEGETTVYIRLGHAGASVVTIQNDGHIGGALILETSASAMGIKLTGAGTCRIARLRALQGNTKSPSIEVDQDVTVTDATAPFTAYTNSSGSLSSENFTLTINSGKTVKIANPNGFFHMGSSSTANNAGSYTYNINGTLDLSESTITSNIIPFANNPSSTITVNVNGLLKLGAGLNLVNSAPSGSDNGNLVFNINNGGMVDATKTTTLTNGNNYFRIAGTGLLNRKVDATDVTFPVGLQSASSPNFVTLNNSGTASNFTVGLSNSFTVAPSSTQIVNRRWNIVAEDQGANANLKLNWKTTEHGVNFDVSQGISLVRLATDNWLSAGASTITGPDGDNFYQVEISSVTTFGEFTLQNTSTLPLDFTSFKAKIKNADFSSQVKLSWTTENEVNTESFLIEKSVNGKSFETIGSVVSKNTQGTNTYNFLDYSPAPNMSYYRLKQVDKDGKFKYSSIRSVNNSVDIQLSVYPNPVSDLINISHPIADHNSILNIFDLKGKLIISLTAKMGTSNTSIKVSEMDSNMYFIYFKKQDYKSALKFIKR